MNGGEWSEVESGDEVSSTLPQGPWGTQPRSEAARVLPWPPLAGLVVVAVAVALTPVSAATAKNCKILKVSPVPAAQGRGETTQQL